MHLIPVCVALRGVIIYSTYICTQSNVTITALQGHLLLLHLYLQSTSSAFIADIADLPTTCDGCVNFNLILLFIYI